MCACIHGFCRFPFVLYPLRFYFIFRIILLLGSIVSQPRLGVSVCVTVCALVFIYRTIHAFRFRMFVELVASACSHEYGVFWCLFSLSLSLFFCETLAAATKAPHSLFSLAATIGHASYRTHTHTANFASIPFRRCCCFLLPFASFRSPSAAASFYCVRHLLLLLPCAAIFADDRQRTTTTARIAVAHRQTRCLLLSFIRLDIAFCVCLLC